jgi:anti-sigma regulatory factor (Ser/Thr protein kinase)
MFISQLDILQINMARQSQDEQNGQKIVFMERIKNMVIHTLNTLMLTQMELDVRLEHGKY